MKLSKEEAKSIYDELIERQSFMLTVIASVAGVLIGLGLFILVALLGANYTSSYYLPVFVLFLPALITVLITKFVGKPLELTYRVIPAVMSVLTYVLGVSIIFLLNPLFLFLAPISFAVAYYFSKAPLTAQQTAALWQSKVT